MINKKTIPLFCLTLVCLLLTSCRNENKLADEIHEEANSIYYWQTVLELDDAEKKFLAQNNVQRVYLRFFDIVIDESPLAMDPVVPNATLQVKDTLPVKEIIPTVYITEEAAKLMKDNEDIWAEKIVKRIFNMCSYNDLPEPNEIQLDCDWTAHSRETFFNLCTEVKKELVNRNPKAKLSSTIRLHQLRQTAPPADYGVLMLYNTGSYKNPEENNSILTVESVKPYLRYLSDYSLPLDYAFPIFSWHLVYRYNTFIGIIKTHIDNNTGTFKNIGDNKYELVTDTTINNMTLFRGYLIRREEVSFNTIQNVKNLIEKHSKLKNHSIILYSLDSRNILNYSEDEIKQIYK